MYEQPQMSGLLTIATDIAKDLKYNPAKFFEAKRLLV